MADYNIIRATLDQVAGMARLTQTVAAEGVYLVTDKQLPLTVIENRLAATVLDDNHLMLVAVDGDDRVSGQVGLHRITTSEAWLGMIVGLPWRRQGLGQQLLNRALDQARSLGLDQVKLEVFVDNQAAINLYYKNRFRRLGPGLVRRDSRGHRRQTMVMSTRLASETMGR